MNLTTAVDRIAHLIPTYRSPNLVGDGVWVLTSPSEVPEFLRVEQRDRNVQYLRTGDRTVPSYAPRYVVRSYGVLIAWVTLDGQTHVADDATVLGAWHADNYNRGARFRAVLRHRDAVRAVWPDRFELNDEDGEVTSRPAPTILQLTAADLRDGDRVVGSSAHHWPNIYTVERTNA